MNQSEILKEKSERFHAFEWIRAEAINKNKYARKLFFEVIRLRKVEKKYNELVKGLES
jgi:hypothetical protein